MAGDINVYIPSEGDNTGNQNIPGGSTGPTPQPYVPDQGPAGPETKGPDTSPAKVEPDIYHPEPKPADTSPSKG